MSKKDSKPSVFAKFDVVAEDITPTATAKPTKGTTTSAALKKKDVIKTSTYLPVEVHDILREIAFHERNKVHDLLLEGIEHVLKTRRHPSISELKTQSESKAA